MKAALIAAGMTGVAALGAYMLVAFVQKKVAPIPFVGEYLPR